MAQVRTCVGVRDLVQRAHPAHRGQPHHRRDDHRRLPRAAERLFADGYLAGASFLVKGTGADSASNPHQDWNIVDERVAQSLSIWCPLVDVDRDNGALVVIPGSHRLRASLRSIDSPSIYLDFTEELEPHLTVVEAAAGEAVLYAHNLFHGSKPNHSSETRVSAVTGVLPRRARHLHYRRAADERFEVLDVDRSFYMEGIPTMLDGAIPPSAVPAETITFERHALGVSEVFEGARAYEQQVRS
ncbi:phytanoyl-CoA dioxygenase family protein [Aquihabitans daechungensis]|uniref:phytanoyl-CoA dioxygenase family protein n=1 Tax=Aquihabitans daechungensis TaxID=1052257 RepID=UPI003BA1A1A2